MFPNIWILDTYSICLFVGIIFCLFIFYMYGIKNKFDKRYIYDIFILACFSIIIGLIFAFLFQKIFDLLKENSINSIGSMTFFGGLIGGVVGFIIGYILIVKKKYPNSSLVNDICIIAPACITCAHAFGRIGCFMAGCCYGIETNSFLGVKFPHLDNLVYPTQLFEACFLFVLSFVLFYLGYKKKYLYTFSIYMFSYGFFRFLIEFIRGDDRGGYILNLSPSQCFSLISILLSVILYIYFLKKYFPNKEV